MLLKPMLESNGNAKKQEKFFKLEFWKYSLIL